MLQRLCPSVCLSVCDKCHAEGNDKRDFLLDAVLGRAVSDSTAE